MYGKFYAIGEIDAKMAAAYLAFSFTNTNADVVISSVGGDIGCTLAMLDDIDYYKRTTLATGICQSAAAVLATAGEGRRICTMDALFRFMRPEEEEMDNPDVLGEKVMRVPDLRHYLHHMMVARVAHRAKLAKIEAFDLFDGKFITSIRAKELGLIDEVISTEGQPDGDPCRFRRSQSAPNCTDSGLDTCPF